MLEEGPDAAPWNGGTSEGPTFAYILPRTFLSTSSKSIGSRPPTSVRVGCVPRNPVRRNRTVAGWMVERMAGRTNGWLDSR